MDQILSIELTDERQFQSVPAARFAVMTRNDSSSPSGATLLVATRGDDVDLYLVSDWIE
jgi:hypothetical protein